MSLLITFLTLVLVLNCALLILLVLIQLPKKEAGAGLAFGGGATDALFGAGSGNALTKLTKYAAATFLTLSLILGVANARIYHSSDSEVRRALQNAKATPAVPAAAPAKPQDQFQMIQSTNALLTTPPTATNAARITTNAAPAAATAANTNAAAPK